MNEFVVALFSGAAAGFSVDVALFPLDTLKTRLQSASGFWSSGGFRGIYKGLSAAAIGSAPGAALFFSTYEMNKVLLKSENLPEIHSSYIHMFAAVLGEMNACLIRVPTEIIKQRMQTGQYVTGGVKEALAHIYANEGGIRGFYRGYSTTILREIPFSIIQFPLYEKFKEMVVKVKTKQPISKNSNGQRVGSVETSALEAAMCGSVAGMIAAAITTPLDVAKTRLMLGAVDVNGVPYKGTMDVLVRLYKEPNANGSAGGVKTLFKGVGPRVMWMGIGGVVFFGAYEASKSRIERMFHMKG